MLEWRCAISRCRSSAGIRGSSRCTASADDSSTDASRLVHAQTRLNLTVRALRSDADDDLHLFGDFQRASIEGASEQARETEHVVDLVREVRTTGRAKQNDASRTTVMSGSTITSVPRQPDQPRASSDQRSAVVATEPRSTTAPCVDGELMLAAPSSDHEDRRRSAPRLARGAPQRLPAVATHGGRRIGRGRCSSEPRSTTECCDKQTEVEHRRASRGSPILCYLSIEPHGSSFAVPRVASAWTTGHE